MFVKPSRLKAQGAAFSTVALLALGACDDPVATTDLRPEGAPEVLAITVLNDPDLFVESATFCKLNDEKRPGNVTAAGVRLCDDDLAQPAGFRDPDTEEFTAASVTDAIPDGWYARVMFDELLDPEIEDLVPVLDSDGNETGFFSGSLLNTQPFTLTCGGDVIDYDGYYSPSGNNITWPVGPSLQLHPVDYTAIASGDECVVSLNDNIIDKDGTKVPDDQRSKTEYKWQLAGLALLETSPAAATPCEGADDCGANGVCEGDGTCDDKEEIAADSPLVLTFNGFASADTLQAANVTILEHAAADCSSATTAVVDGAKDISGDPLDHEIVIGLNNAGVDLAWKPDIAYTVTIDATVTDVAGGPATLSETICFLTEAP